MTELLTSLLSLVLTLLLFETLHRPVVRGVA